MKSLAGLMFGTVILILVVAGFMLLYTSAQSRQLPDFPEYTQTNQSINQSVRMIMAPAPAMVNALVPFIVLGLFMVPVGVLVLVHKGTKPRGF